ncbi:MULTISPECIES: FmdB family zinc ribbon protein [unclassified Microbacterium]|jgi:putative FmdB family regulatory protein|uniref:FmdB family zinc ribbon protein n=1 Tax=unclassified Microbacterium TaxID=2609290 RepID=UPI0002587B40|nr:MULTISPECIES: FmdB family zinc ribbon protein [unclassified Microbacterium]EIC07052.1 regulatory protein, FmdB family [Microbacterium laevaniformans OR221]ODT23086.1 MAG: FmdB family transcriptional regulator [Microbacterium sp. SCN 69-37]RKS93528.1 putative FmdB family regulatory protein [Microbacterium sp. AG790]
MPTYAYACTQCGHRFDAVQSFSDAALTQCPECGGALRKQYGTVGVTFNGSGFYRTDSRSSTSGGGAGAGASTSTSSKSEAKSSPASSGS